VDLYKKFVDLSNNLCLVAVTNLCVLENLNALLENFSVQLSQIGEYELVRLLCSGFSGTILIPSEIENTAAPRVRRSVECPTSTRENPIDVGKVRTGRACHVNDQDCRADHADRFNVAFVEAHQVRSNQSHHNYVQVVRDNRFVKLPVRHDITSMVCRYSDDVARRAGAGKRSRLIAN